MRGKKEKGGEMENIVYLLKSISLYSGRHKLSGIKNMTDVSEFSIVNCHQSRNLRSTSMGASVYRIVKTLHKKASNTNLTIKVADAIFWTHCSISKWALFVVLNYFWQQLIFDGVPFL